MKKISLKIPLIPSALIRAAEMLSDMADDLEADEVLARREAVKRAGTSRREVIVLEEAPAERDAAKAFSEKKPADSATGQGASTETTTSAPAPAGGTTETTNISSAVEIDSAGLPWDHRINSLAADKSHPRLVKTDTWKLKRGIDPVLVEQVQAELRAAMAVPGPDTTTPALLDPGPTAATEEPAVVWTFPTLMAAITAGGFEQPQVLAAVQSAGIPAVPLLAARPDLIPIVAAELGL